MSRNLVIVESPAKARTIERYLGDNYKVLASYGHVRDLPENPGKGKLGTVFEIPPSGSLLLFISNQPLASRGMPKAKPQVIDATGAPTVRRIEPNVLTIDYVDIAAGGQTQKAVYVLKARDFAYAQNGKSIGISRDPWDRAVQFKDELLKKQFPADSGFEATYHFTIAEKVPASLWAVIEHPEMYTITCNGKNVSATKGEWWLDKSFGKIDIASAAKVGDNAVTLKASPMTIFHELDCAYVLGDFAVQAADHGFTITPPPAEWKLAAWNEQGCPFYAAGVAYTEKFKIEKPNGTYRVALGKWLGSVASVTVNGKPAGYVAYPPWECDVTKEIKAGENEIVVTVIGTLKNTLGPHHAGPGLGSAWPGMWDQAPEHQPAGKDYATVGYGLFEPFTLKQAAESPGLPNRFGPRIGPSTAPAR